MRWLSVTVMDFQTHQLIITTTTTIVITTILPLPLGSTTTTRERQWLRVLVKRVSQHTPCGHTHLQRHGAGMEISYMD